MATCAYCHKKLDEFPFRCKFCGQEFCSEHRLPENHECAGLDAYKERQAASLSKAEPKKPIEYFYDKGGNAGYGHRRKKKPKTPVIIVALGVILMIAGFANPVFYYVGFVLVCAGMIKYLMPR